MKSKILNQIIIATGSFLFFSSIANAADQCIQKTLRYYTVINSGEGNNSDKVNAQAREIETTCPGVLQGEPPFVGNSVEIRINTYDTKMLQVETTQLYIDAEGNPNSPGALMEKSTRPHDYTFFLVDDALTALDKGTNVRIIFKAPSESGNIYDTIFARFLLSRQEDLERAKT